MTDGRFSLTRVRIKNYRSIAAADVQLGALLILVGPNGAGKSNFLDALRLVAESLQTSIDQALRDRGGVAEVRRRSAGHPTHFALDIDFTGAGFDGSYGFDVAAVAGGGFRISRESCRLGYRREDAAVAEAHFEVRNGEVVSASEPVMPPASTDRLYLVSAAGLAPFRGVFDGLAAISVVNLNPDAMRDPRKPDPGRFLRRDGANLASVLHRLDRQQRPDKVRIEDYLRHLVPGMRNVSRKELGAWETLEFTQDVAGAKSPWRFPAQSVSDGTLRAVGVLVALFAGSGPAPSPIGIEEPEAGLHPAAAVVLLDAIRDAAERRQVIVTSHSPDLLDRHDFTLPEIRAVRSVAGETVIGELDPAGALALRDQLFTPGELLRNDQLLPAGTEIVR